MCKSICKAGGSYTSIWSMCMCECVCVHASSSVRIARDQTDGPIFLKWYCWLIHGRKFVPFTWYHLLKLYHKKISHKKNRSTQYKNIASLPSPLMTSPFLRNVARTWMVNG